MITTHPNNKSTNMKKTSLLFILSFAVLTAFSQVTLDSAQSYVNSNIVTNGSKQITGLRLNTALNNMINGTRNLRKVDSVFINSDSIVYRINGARYAVKITDASTFSLTKNTGLDSIVAVHNGNRYAVKDSAGQVDTDSQSLQLTYADSISLSITRGNTIKFAYAIDSVGTNNTSDSLVTFKGGIRRAYSFGSISLEKNAARDSIVLVHNGTRYAVKDSTGGGASSGSLSGLTAATATNSIDNGSNKQRWIWTSVAGDTAVVIGSTGTAPASSLHNALTVFTSGANGTTGQTTYAARFSNTRTGAGSSNIAADFASSGGAATNYAINVSAGDVNLGGNQRLKFGGTNAGFYVSGSVLFGLANTSSYMQFQQNATNGFVLTGSDANVRHTFAMESTTKMSHLFNADFNAGSYRSVGTTNGAIIFDAGKLHLTANTGESGGYASFTPREILTISGGATQAASNVGIGTTSPNASAKLQISSTTSGFLPPVMTGAQAEAISTPAEGLLVYCNNGNGSTINTTGWWGYNGSTWVKLN